MQNRQPQSPFWWFNHWWLTPFWLWQARRSTPLCAVCVRARDIEYSSLSGWPGCGCVPTVNCLHNRKDSVRRECGCELTVKRITLRLQQMIYTLSLVLFFPPIYRAIRKRREWNCIDYITMHLHLPLDGYTKDMFKGELAEGYTDHRVRAELPVHTVAALCI